MLRAAYEPVLIAQTGWVQRDFHLIYWEMVKHLNKSMSWSGKSSISMSWSGKGRSDKSHLGSQRSDKRQSAINLITIFIQAKMIQHIDHPKKLQRWIGKTLLIKSGRLSLGENFLMQQITQKCALITFQNKTDWDQFQDSKTGLCWLWKVFPIHKSKKDSMLKHGSHPFFKF